MTETQIAIKEQINELRAKQRKYLLKEWDCTKQAKFCMQVQNDLEEDILSLEHELSKQKVLEAL